MRAIILLSDSLSQQLWKLGFSPLLGNRMGRAMLHEKEPD